MAAATRIAATTPSGGGRAEALLLAGSVDALSAAGAALAELRGLGMAVGVAAPASLERLEAALAGAAGPGLALLAELADGGAGRARVVLGPGRLRSAWPTASPATAAVEAVAAAVAAWLSRLGVGAVSQQRDAGSALLVFDPAGASLADLAVAAARAAGEAGHGQARVAAAPNGLVVSLDHADEAIAWMREQLWVLAGIDGGAVLELRDPSPPDAAAAARHQAERRAAGELPGPVVAAGWRVEIQGVGPLLERVHEALLCLTESGVGVSGAPVAAHPDAAARLLAAGVFDGKGAETRLLEAPSPFPTLGELDPAGSLRRTIDLRSGLLYEDALTDHGPLRSVRFLSAAEPGLAVLRAHRAGEVSADAPADVTTTATTVTTAAVGGGEIVTASLRAGRDWFSAIEPAAAGPAHPDAEARARRAADAGFDGLLAEHRTVWAQRWADADVMIEGDDELQHAVRFALARLLGAAPENGEAAVGARGVTGPAYRGHVFWDADTFVLPFLAATRPKAARAMLEYRLRRLPAARAAAQALGREGARFPWESARSGCDVTPNATRDRTGRLVPIRTGLLEEHIVAQVAWAACCYADWSGDDAFLQNEGASLLTETARYWASRVRIERDGVGHVYGVIGPDEYHEPVDDNAFTNVMARWNLRRGADAADRRGELGAEADRWRRVADSLVDGFDDDTGLYCQFAGFYDLEPLIVAEAAPRRPIAADLLLGADRVRRSQVIKQADVLMLHHLLPDEVEPDSLAANLRFYEPRTAHGSSLSPAVHASLFARARELGPALDALRTAARIDLDDLTGTTAGGLHLAAMGGLWQAIAYGFCGARPRGQALGLDPRLPPSWTALELRVRFRGSRVRIRKEHDSLFVCADPAVDVVLDGAAYAIPPRGLSFVRRGGAWKPDQTGRQA